MLFNAQPEAQVSRCLVNKQKVLRGLSVFNNRVGWEKVGDLYLTLRKDWNLFKRLKQSCVWRVPTCVGTNLSKCSFLSAKKRRVIREEGIPKL